MAKSLQGQASIWVNNGSQDRSGETHIKRIAQSVESVVHSDKAVAKGYLQALQCCLSPLRQGSASITSPDKATNLPLHAFDGHSSLIHGHITRCIYPQGRSVFVAGQVSKHSPEGLRTAAHWHAALRRILKSPTYQLLNRDSRYFDYTVTSQDPGSQGIQFFYTCFPSESPFLDLSFLVVRNVSGLACGGGCGNYSLPKRIETRVRY